MGEAAKNLVQQVQSVCDGHKGVRQTRRCKWTPPPAGDFKANFDGAWFDESDEVGIGIMVRNSSGLVLAALAEKIKKTTFCGLPTDDGNKKGCDFCSRHWITKLPI